MKLKKVLKYQLLDCRNSFLIFSGIFLLLTLVNSVNGFEITFAIFGFTVGLCSFSENFHMLIQNGISRKTMFLGRIALIIITGILFAAMNEVFFLIQRARGFQPMDWLQTDSTLNGASSFLLSKIAPPLFTMSLVMAAMMFGYFLAILFYRSGKAGRLCIAAGLPISIFVVLPTLVFFYQDTPVVKWLINFFILILGLKSGNPFCSIGTCAVVFLLLAGFSFLLMHKVPLKR